MLAASESVAFLQHLTALTSLEVPLATTAGLSGLAACTRLRSVTLLKASNRAPRLLLPEFASLARLTGLTRLCIMDGMHGSPPSPAFYSCLGKLLQLREVAASSWTPQALHALSQLRWLRRLDGSWCDAAQGAVGWWHESNQ